MPQRQTSIFRFLLFIFLFSWGNYANAQLAEQYSKINYLPKSNLLFAIDSLSNPDTVPQRFQVYHPLYRNEIAFLDQGNIVSAYQPLLFNAERESGLDLGIQQSFQHYLYTPEKMRMYKVQRAYTDLFYAQGGEEFIALKALHTQNIKPNWNIGIDYNRFKSNGFQLRQLTGVYNTRLFSWYHSPDESHHLIVSATWNRIRNEENGGISSDSAFEANSGISQVDVRLGDDEDKVRNYIKTNDYRITNMWRLGKKRQLKYYLPEAGTWELDTNKTLIPNYVITHEFAYTGNRYLFTDLSYDTGGYYPSTLFNDEQTFDSIQHNTISNVVTISTAPFMGYLSDSLPVKKALMISATAGIDYHTISWQGQTNAEYNNSYVGGSIRTNPYLQFPITFNAEGKFWLTGYNQADYKVKGQLSLDIQNIALDAGALFQAYEPQITQSFFLGNHNFWDYSFNKTFVNTLSAGIRTRRLKNNYYLTVKQQLVNNFIYFDSTFTAQQEAKAISITTINFKKKFTFWKLHLDNNITAQFTNNSEALRIPQLVSNNSLYFQGFMFKKAMYAQIGVGFFYYSDIKANTYDPETKQWYIQNNVSIGNYPLFNAFINGHVRQFSFTLKMEHVSEGFFGNRYYASPHNPLDGRVFRLGIAWKFFN